MAAPVPRRLVGRGVIAVVHDDGVDAWIDVQVTDRHVPAGERESVVEAALACPEVRRSSVLHVALPIGEPEIVLCLQRRFEVVHTRAAGSSCLVDVPCIDRTPVPDRRAEGLR